VDVRRVVADLGNSRLKWAALGPNGVPGEVVALPVESPDDWASAVVAIGSPARQRWAISSVNPPALARLRSILQAQGVGEVRAFVSAADVPLSNALESPGRTGADRALLVMAALGLEPGRDGPGVVVSCGTAVTVERIEAGPVWLGGAIAPGLGPMSRALHDLTAQLPEVRLRADDPTPPAFGRATAPALAAGLYWGLVGSVRELLNRAVAELGSTPWVVWTGGDAARLSAEVAGPSATLVPDLVLRGLARAAFGPGGPA
jgi:type III pantothenate kinase